MGKLLKGPKAPPPPPIESPAVMPVADDTNVALDKKRTLAKRANRSGRASTILSQDNGGGLGG